MSCIKSITDSEFDKHHTCIDFPAVTAFIVLLAFLFLLTLAMDMYFDADQISAFDQFLQYLSVGVFGAFFFLVWREERAWREISYAEYLSGLSNETLDLALLDETLDERSRRLVLHELSCRPNHERRFDS